MLHPTDQDRHLTDVCGQLLSAARETHRLGHAFAAVSAFLGGCGAQLVRLSIELPESSIHAFRRDAQDPMLLGLLEAFQADHGLYGVVRSDPGVSEVLVILCRGDPLGAQAAAWLQLLLPHVRAALDIREQLDSPLPTTAIATQLVRLVPTPCVLTDEAARCIESNDAFGKVLPGLSGAVRSGRVLFTDHFLQGSWQQALLEAHATATVQSLLANSTTGAQWKLHVVPFACAGAHAGAPPRLLMFAFLEKFNGAATQSKTLPSSRPLTKAELEVLANLLLGQTAKAIARGRGASVNTVRSQITSILGKTGHRTQKELIASFNTSSFGMATDDAE